jgi:hypothetical protein
MGQYLRVDGKQAQQTDGCRVSDIFLPEQVIHFRPEGKPFLTVQKPLRRFRPGSGPLPFA